MQSITNRSVGVRLRRRFCIFLALGLASAAIASCTPGGAESHEGTGSANQAQAFMSNAQTTRVHTWLACLRVACQTGPAGGLEAAPPSGSGGGLAPPDNGPVARFDWSMPPRFDASWHAWKPYATVEGLLPDDDSCDDPPCLFSEGMYDYSPSFVSPRQWNPFFSACFSLGGGSPLVSFQWGLWRDGREIDTAHTSSCVLGNHPSDPPDQRLDFPALGSYFVSLSVTNHDGKSASTVREVTVRDLLVVSFGDSSASGEGNRASTGWEDGRCHRSRTSGPALAAKYLEEADPKTSVTYLDFACSGASVTNGIIGPYNGELPPPHVVAPLEPQVDALVRAICGGRPAWRCQPSEQRPVDILTINIGVNDLRFSDLLQDCELHACLDHHWDTALPRELADILQHNHRAPSCETAQQRFEQIPSQGDAVRLAFEQAAAADAAKKDCDTKNWGHSFEYIADRLKIEGVKVAQTYMTTYPVNFLSGGPGQSETTSGCGAFTPKLGVVGIGHDEAAFMTAWGYRLNDVIVNEAVRLGWYPVTGLPEAFRGHGYCSDKSWFVSLLGSRFDQGNIKGTFHPNQRGHAAWAARYLAWIAAPKPSSHPPESSVQVHLQAFRVFLPGIGPEGSNGQCYGNSVSGIPVRLLAFASLSEAGFDKPEAQATYQVRMKSIDAEFQPSEWYQFPGDTVLTFPLSSVDKALDVTIGTPLCNGSLGEPESGVVHIHRLRRTFDGSDLAGVFQLRSSAGDRAIEVSGCIDVVPAGPPSLLGPTGFLSSCQLRQAEP
jgi:hypothetical protein